MGIGLVLGTHGSSAVELLKSASMIMGQQENVKTIEFVPGEGPEDLKRKYNEAIDQLDCTDGLIFLVDIFGGSPFNAAADIALRNENYEIITGINVPMVIEALSSREFLSLEETVEAVINTSKDSIKRLEKIVIEEDDEGDDL